MSDELERVPRARYCTHHACQCARRAELAAMDRDGSLLAEATRIDRETEVCCRRPKEGPKWER